MVVADTSPVNYLVLIAQISLLARLYTRILIPPAVLEELKHPLAKAVRDWVDNAPMWLEVHSPKTSLIPPKLDLGETEAIALATERLAEVLLIDEQAGRQEALGRGLKFAGTLSVIDAADQAGLVIFDDAVADLRKTSFRLSRAVLAEIRRSDPAKDSILRDAARVEYYTESESSLEL
jgi:predicted nucleic acid-binding protein